MTHEDSPLAAMAPTSGNFAVAWEGIGQGRTRLERRGGEITLHHHLVGTVRASVFLADYATRIADIS